MSAGGQCTQRAASAPSEGPAHPARHQRCGQRSGVWRPSRRRPTTSSTACHSPATATRRSSNSLSQPVRIVDTAHCPATVYTYSRYGPLPSHSLYLQSIYEVWLKRNRTVLAGQKVGDTQASEPPDINLYHCFFLSLVVFLSLV